MGLKDLRDRLNERVVRIMKLILGAVGVYILAMVIDFCLKLLLNSPETFLGGLVRYLPANLLMLAVAWMTRDLKEVGAKRGVGISAAFRCMVQFFPVFHISWIEGEWTLSFRAANDFSSLLSLSPPTLFIPLCAVGFGLGIVGTWLFADNLTERTLSLWPGYTWDECISIIGALLVTFMLVHEPGHILFGLLFGVPVKGVGLMFPVGAYTSFAGQINLSLPAFWLLLMGGNIMTLTVAFLARNALYNKFLRDLGIICAISTAMNSQILPGTTIDGTLLFLAFWNASPILGVATAVIQGLFVLASVKILHQLIREEAYGSLPVFHDTRHSRGEREGLGEEYEEVWGTA